MAHRCRARSQQLKRVQGLLPESPGHYTYMCHIRSTAGGSGSEASSYSRLIDFVYHSTLGLRVIKKQKKKRTGRQACFREEGGRETLNLRVTTLRKASIDFMIFAARICHQEGRCKATWKRESKLPWREAGPPNHHDDKVDSDQ